MEIIFLVHIIAILFSLFVAGAMLGAAFSKPFRTKVAKILHLEFLVGKFLKKSSHNPIIRPGTTPWTAEAVMNPAAIVLNGRTHLIYRAIGMDGISRLGYASSPNGIVFDDQFNYPAYVANQSSSMPKNLRHYSPMTYPSGGSWGGCEDPRMAVINGRVYVTFNMFQNWTLRVAAISISEEDFLAKRFYAWEKPIILSHGNRDKNWVLFPEKINEQFAVLHSIIGEDKYHVRIEYVDNLEHLSMRRFPSPDPQKVSDKLIAWHVHTRSAGPPPVRTSRGWLILYHANDAQEPSKYKLGAMLLDLNDPTKIMYRSNKPVLTPDEHYENAGKPGIVYACGAVVRDGTLYIYYGGADKVVCVATADLETFVDSIIKESQPVLKAVPTQTV